MSSFDQNIPFVSLEKEVGRNFDIRPLRRNIDPEKFKKAVHRHNFQELLWVRRWLGTTSH